MSNIRHPHPHPAFDPSLRSPQSHIYHSQVQGSPRNSTHIPEQVVAPPTPENLHRSNGDAFNVDPNVPYLEARGKDAQEGQVSPPTGRNFVGGFVGGVKRVFRGNRPNKTNSPEEGMVIITTNPEGFTPSPSQLEHQLPHAQPHPMNSAHVYQTHTSPPPPQVPPSVVSISRKSNSTAYGDATAVNHEPLPEPLPMGSPVYVDPQPGSDYAKMDSPTPPPSTASLGSYISRVHRFFQNLNDLPWVASERVTVDYYPGHGQRAARRRSAARTRSPLPPPPQRPVMSWYDTNNPARQGLVDLFSPSSSPSTVMAEIQIQGSQPLPKNARVVYPAVYGPASTLQHNLDPNTAPAPVHAAPPVPVAYRATVRTESSSSSREESYHRPMYPHGYVSYQEHGAAGAQYAADTIHHLA
jgi:hypothetical protein